MQKKQFPIMPKGMQKDLAVSIFPNEMAFDIKNMRLTVSKDNHLLGLVNEKGNTKVEWELNLFSENNIIKDTVTLGLYTLDKYIVIFAKASIDNVKEDIIIRVEINTDNKLSYVILYKGDLNFKEENPIECEGIYENEYIQKVYWVDGVNQLRVININPKVHKEGSINEPYYTDNLFDVIPNVITPKVDVDTLLYGGEFPSGVIQHAMSYYRKNGQESSLVWVSPIRYLGKLNGLSPEDKCTDSFNIKIEGPIDLTFDYIRLYSIVRTSLNDTPVVKIIKDIEIKNINTSNLDKTPLIIEDNGTEGYPISSTYLLFLNNNIVYPNTLASKDNTLFIGNIKVPETKVNIEEDVIKNNIIINTLYKDNLYYDNVDSLNYEGTLDHSAKKITTFKWDEYYRLGIQGKRKDGTLSDVKYIGDVLQDKHPDIINNVIRLPYFQVQVLKPITDIFKENGYSELRLVMAERNTINKRRVLGQGILCPTLFRLEDRMENGPFAQSSWIMRGAGKHGFTIAPNNTSEGELQCAENTGNFYISAQDVANIRIRHAQTLKTIPLEGKIRFEYTLSTEDKKTVIAKDFRVGDDSETDILYEQIKNSMARYVNPDFIPSQDDWGGTKQDFTYNVDITELTTKALERLKKQRNNFYIDDSIVTFHSPELDSYQYSIDSNIKLRIIGVLDDFTETSNFYIKSSTGPRNPKATGVKTANLSYLKSNLLWNDSYKSGEPESIPLNFATYMWHRHGSLNADDKPTGDEKRKAVLQKKIIINSRLAKTNKYYSELAEDKSNIESSYWEDLPSDIRICNQDYVYSLLINGEEKEPKFHKYNYYGNIDKVLTFTSDEGYSIMGKDIAPTDIINYDAIPNAENPIKGLDEIPIKYKSTPHTVIRLSKDTLGNQIVLPYKEDLMIPTNAKGTFWDKVRYSAYEVNEIRNIGGKPDANTVITGWKIFEIDNNIKSNSGIYQNVEISIEGIKKKEWKKLNVYPKTIIGVQYGTSKLKSYDITYQGTVITNIVESSETKSILYKRDIRNNIGSSKDVIYLAELYRDFNPYEHNKENLQEDLKRETWIPISSFKSINTLMNLDGYRGDTYYQRWDCLKTYPFTKEDVNQVIDITSFMVESHINLDGRYDRRRYTDLTIDNTNFNKINPVYSQSDNYFNYHIIDSDTENFPNQIMWSMTKTLGEKIDSWTNIIASNVLDLDGDKGTISSLNRFNNEIYAFQDKGIARIIFNPRAAVSTSDGIPIELTNAYKVDGKVYMSDKYGCTNKWAIAESPLGIYFADSNIRTICLFNGQNIEDIATSKGMYSWTKANIDSTIWNPKMFKKEYLNNKALKLHYDITTNDLYITNAKTALAYNEKLGCFSSFYSYERVPWMFNIKGQSYQFRDGNIWKLYSNDLRCNFFDFSRNYSIQLVANPEFTLDKIFENIEFRTNDISNIIYNKPNEYPFTSIYVNNEYQSGSGNTQSLKKRFRTWRWQLPRNNRDRIRNPWTYISMSGTLNKELILYDTAVTYYI